MTGLRPYMTSSVNKKQSDPFNSKLLLNKPRPPKDVPPLDPELKEKINQSLNQSLLDTKLFSGPPALVHAGFEGGMSISQRQIEHARSRFLLDKLTGKISTDYRQNFGGTLPPIDGVGMSTPSRKGRRSVAESSAPSESPRSSIRKADREEDDLERAGKEEETKKAEPRKWVDLDKYIELLLDSKSEDEIVFVYLNPNENGDPYDLKVCAYHERSPEKYYTLSGKGLTVYENDNPVEFISLG